MILPLIFLKTLAHKIEMIRNQLRNDIDRIKWKNLEIYFNYRPKKKAISCLTENKYITITKINQLMLLKK